MTVHDHPLADLVPATPRAYQRIEIANALRRLCSESELYWNSMSADEFVSSFGAAWSPADNVRHLTKSVLSVTRAMRLPKPLLFFVFGPSRGVSRGYRELVAVYHRRLRAGGQAGRFAPRPRTVNGNLADYRRLLLGQHRAAVSALASDVTRWSHRSIDRLRLPHPLLGKLTVREMLLFTLYHNLHHVHVVARRRGEYFTDETPLSGPA